MPEQRPTSRRAQKISDRKPRRQSNDLLSWLQDLKEKHKHMLRTSRAAALTLLTVSLTLGCNNGDSSTQNGSGGALGGTTGSGGQTSSAGGATGAGGVTSKGGATGTAGQTGKGGAGGATTGGTTAACTAGTPLTGGKQICSSTQGSLGNGYDYSVWLSSSTTGTNCGTFYGTGAALKAQWSMGSGGDFLARAGLSWNKTKTYDQLGTISADYAYTKTGVTGTTSYIGIYGWSSAPLVEFYIVEEWIGWNPASNATKKGTFPVDGATYDVYTHTQTNQPSIEGTQTFPQFFSIKQKATQCGHISISEHFKQWASLGMTLGKMYEAKVLVEAMGGSGTVDFTSATVTVK
jgi:hypothetical protein